jgi:hypothetical protein
MKFIKILSAVLKTLHAGRQRNAAMLTAKHRDWYGAAEMT